MKGIIMKKIYRICISIILSLIMIVGFIPVSTVSAADNAVEITVSSSEVIKGSEFTVTVTLNCSKGINAAWFNVDFDTNYFSCGDYAGRIPINYLEMDYPTTLSWSYTFKAIQVGTGTISVASGGDYADADANPFSPSLGSASVKVWAEGSDDATLSSLQVAGAALSPDFAKWTLDYTCYVDNSVTAVNIGAAASQGGTVEVGGNFSNLAVGSNLVTVTSYAPNGKKMTYNINVVRLEPPTEPPATEPPTTTEPETTIAPIEDSITIGGNKYTIDSGYSSDIIPSGFNADVVSYNGKDVLAAVSTKYNVTLFYLVDDNGEGRFYMYDSADKSFFPYTAIESGAHRYILADASGSDERPAGCSEGQITINGVTFDAFVSDSNGDYAYFYAIGDTGIPGWYCYDKFENTVQRMFAANLNEVPEETSPEEETTEEPTEATEPTTDDGRLSSLENDNNNLRKDNSDLKRMRNLIIAIASVLLVVMLVIIVVMAAHKSGKKHSIDIDADDFADEEDEIDKTDMEMAAGRDDVEVVEESVMDDVEDEYYDEDGDGSEAEAEDEQIDAGQDATEAWQDTEEPEDADVTLVEEYEDADVTLEEEHEDADVTLVEKHEDADVTLVEEPDNAVQTESGQVSDDGIDLKKNR